MKFKIFMGLAGVLTGVVLLFASSANGVRELNISSKPASSPTAGVVNEIVLGESADSQTKYGIVTDQDTLAVITTGGEKVFASLENREWKSPLWSKTGGLLGVLGKSDSGVYDLYIYNFSERKLTRYTDYSSVMEGVTSFAWIDNNRILFIQGSEPNHWLHRLSLQSGGEIIKLAKVKGEIVSITPKSSRVVMKDDTTFYILNTSGQTQIELKTLSDKSGSLYSARSLIVNDDAMLVEGVIDQNEIKFFYKKFGDLDYKEFLVDGTKKPACIQEDFELVYLEQNESKLVILKGAAESEPEIISSINSDQGTTIDNIKCMVNDELYFSSSSNNKTTWINFSNNTLNTLSQIEAKFMDIRE